jgi:hypothetical protein
MFMGMVDRGGQKTVEKGKVKFRLHREVIV